MADAHALEVEGTTKTQGAEPHDSLKTGDLRGLNATVDELVSTGGFQLCGYKGLGKKFL